MPFMQLRHHIGQDSIACFEPSGRRAMILLLRLKSSAEPEVLTASRIEQYLVHARGP